MSLSHEKKTFIVYISCLAALSYFDVALAEVEFEIEFAYNIWPVCLPKLASADLNLR